MDYFFSIFKKNTPDHIETLHFFYYINTMANNVVPMNTSGFLVSIQSLILSLYHNLYLLVYDLLFKIVFKTFISLLLKTLGTIPRKNVRYL